MGRRIGGSKAIVQLNRRPLISYPLDAVWRALGNVTIIAKGDTELPGIPGAAVWISLKGPPLACPGLRSKVSIWLGPPFIHSRIQARLRSGLAAAALASCSSQPETE